MKTRSIIFKINSRSLLIIIGAFLILGFFSIQLAGSSVLGLVRELMEKNLRDQIEYVQSRYKTLDNMGMAQDEDTVAKYQQQIFEKLKTFKYKNTGCLYVLDDAGKVLMGSKAGWPMDVSKEKFFTQMKAQGHGMVSISMQGIKSTAVFDTFDKWKWIMAVQMQDNEIYTPVHALARTFTKICFMALVIITLIFYVGIFFGITKPMKKIIEELLERAQVTTSTATQVSGLAQQLSQGSTQQAVSLEEASSSLDEMSSMTNQNADNAAKATQLASLAQEQAKKGATSMKEIQTAMVDINGSSQKMFKIIKTIEEIAFQTNLLALNAAVEAARAGEHGKGFAVVANEVRSLAQRASKSAKETSDLIESCVQTAKNGENIVERSSDVLAKIMESSVLVSNIINNISCASKEQAQGIGQVNNTVNQIDQVTQQTAASAKQGLAAAKDLSHQAEELKKIALRLQELVSGENHV